jgi:hypothetical protein
VIVDMVAVAALTIANCCIVDAVGSRLPLRAVVPNVYSFYL